MSESLVLSPPSSSLLSHLNSNRRRLSEGLGTRLVSKMHRPPDLCYTYCSQSVHVLCVQVVDGDATPSHAPLGLKRDTHVTSHDLNQLYENHNCSAWLQECATVLSRVSVFMYQMIAIFIVGNLVRTFPLVGLNLLHTVIWVFRMSITHLN